MDLMCTKVSECNTWWICWNKGNSEMPEVLCPTLQKTPVKTALCVGVSLENKSKNVLMRKHTHRHYEFGLLIPVCATYDHRKLSNPFPSSLSLCEEGRWVIVNGLGRAMKWLNHTCYHERKTTREEMNTGTEEKDKTLQGKPVKASKGWPDHIAKSKCNRQRVCLSVIFILLNMHLIIIIF